MVKRRSNMRRMDQFVAFLLTFSYTHKINFILKRVPNILEFKYSCNVIGQNNFWLCPGTPNHTHLNKIKQFVACKDVYLIKTKN